MKKKTNKKAQNLQENTKDKSSIETSKELSKSESKEASKEHARMMELRKRLPNIDELLREHDIIEEHITSRLILSRMAETVEEYIKIIIQILQPEEFHSLHECNSFDDTEKGKLLDLYKKLMITHREMLKAQILNKEDNNILTINLINAEIAILKPQIIKIVQKMQDSWKETARVGRQGYMG